MSIEEFNNLSEHQMKDKLKQCCGSSTWVNRLFQAKPFQNISELLSKADKTWSLCNEKDWLEAFSHHPKIGDLKSLEKKFAATKSFAKGEQSSVEMAPLATLEKLAEGNALYENKFGFIFIVCATGKSADEMLQLLDSRIKNDRTTELNIASAEQHKITRLRLQKIFS